MSELQPILERLTRLETREDEKWIAHDTRSDERYNGLAGELKSISRKLDKLPCHLQARDITLNSEHRKRQEKWFIFVWGAILANMVKAFFFSGK